MATLCEAHAPTYRFKPSYEDRYVSTDQGSQRVCDDTLRPAVRFAFPDMKVEVYRRSLLHLNLISVVDESTLNWCEQNLLHESISGDLLFAKIQSQN